MKNEAFLEHFKGPALVTGATGFIGKRVLSRLRRSGITTRALVLPNDTMPVNDGNGLQIIRGDIRDPMVVENAVKGCTAVIHLAAIVGDWGAKTLHEEVTVGGTKNVFQSALKHQVKAVLASSIVVYGNYLPQKICTEDLEHGPALGPYSKSKQAQERLAKEFASQGLKVCTVRLANIYGVGSGPWYHDLIDLIKKGYPCMIGDGKVNAGLCHVDNAVDILLRAAVFPQAIGRVYNACDNLDVTWCKYISDLCNMLQTGPTRPKRIPKLLAKLLSYLLEWPWRIANIKTRPPITRESYNLVASSIRVPSDRVRKELGHKIIIGYKQAMQEMRHAGSSSLRPL